MDKRPDDREFRNRIQRIESLVQDADRFVDPKAREQTRAIVQGLMDLHGAGLNRMLEMIAGSGPPGLALIDSLAGDELVGSLFLLYGLHPLDLETRVRQALDKVRPHLRSHGVAVEWTGMADGRVQLRMHGDCEGCGSSAESMKQAIEEAIYETAPDVAAIVIEESTYGEEVVGRAQARVALPVLGR